MLVLLVYPDVSHTGPTGRFQRAEPGLSIKASWSAFAEGKRRSFPTGRQVARRDVTRCQPRVLSVIGVRQEFLVGSSACRRHGQSQLLAESAASHPFVNETAPAHSYFRRPLTNFGRVVLASEVCKQRTGEYRMLAIA